MKFVLFFLIIIKCFLFASVNAQNFGIDANSGVTDPFPLERPSVDFSKKPGESWPGLYSRLDSEPNHRDILGSWLLYGTWDENVSVQDYYGDREYEYEGYDGWYNNFARPDSGAIDRPLLRRIPAAYEDGTYLPSGSDRPNPLLLSDELLTGGIGTVSKTGKNALLVFFGQQVVEEILDAQRAACPPEYFNIEIPKDHSYFTEFPKHSELPVLRTRYDQRTGYTPNNPRQQLNEITPYFDGGLFYGITKLWSDQLRTYKNGTLDPNGLLASSHDGLFPEVNDDRLPMANPPPPLYHERYINRHSTERVSRFFKLGNPRGNENPFLLTFGVMWFRWHNYLAKIIRRKFPNWPSEKVYNEARKWVIASHQRIVYYEWLPKWVVAKPLPRYTGYDPSVDPQIDQFFQAAAFRFGHTLVVPAIHLRDYIRNNCSITAFKGSEVRTCNSFWRPQEVLLEKNERNESDIVDIDRVLMGMAVQMSEREDHQIVEDLRGNVFGPLEFPRRDLMAINIQRGRDHGLPDFNTIRKAYGLNDVDFSYYEQFADLNVSGIPEKLANLYNNDKSKIDLWVGGILETTTGPGALFTEIILDQFQRIRAADRFWFENTKNGLFIDNELDRLSQLRLYDVIMAVTKMDPDDLPRDVFQVPSEGPLIPLCGLQQFQCNRGQGQAFDCYSLRNRNLQECVRGISYDYFRNSEASFILTFAAVGTFIAGIFGFVFLLLKNRKRANFAQAEKTVRQSFKHQKDMHPLFIGNEWTGPKSPSRRVVLIMKAQKKQLDITSHTGTLLRALDFSNENTKTEVYRITDAPYVIIKTSHNYDLVVQFESEYLRNDFLQKFEMFVSDTQIQRENMTTFNLSAALKLVVTKEVRQKRLEMFFRVVFAQAFKIDHSQREVLSVGTEESKEVINTELTITEFAEALSMSPRDLFVQRIFALIDKDRNGFVSFREFIDLLIIFADGNEEQKAKLLFDMYDIDSTGYISIDDFKIMIKSFLETVGGIVDEDQLEKTINAMLKNANIANKQHLSFENFISIVGSDIKSLNKAKLGFKSGLDSGGHGYIEKARETIENIYESHSDIKARFQGNVQEEQDRFSKTVDQNQEEYLKQSDPPRELTYYGKVVRFVELKSQEIFWFTLYTLVLVAIFSERAYYYSVEREHSGLRRIAGYGVTITRGAASAMMFTYSSLLVTMCRNTITFLRDTVANKYFPFDASIQFHKYIAMWALAFTILHIIGHAFNFYHISTQTADDLTCLFRNFFHATHELPKFHYWCWQTITGFTGIVLTLIGAVIYIFAHTIVRRKLYNWFWYTHSLYPLFFIFMFFHGMGRLIQPPFFYYFSLGPIVLFIIDTLISTSRKRIEIPVINAEILPSSVTMLEFSKPVNFQYKSGQWVRIACLELNPHEYHPFTLSSCPEEENLTVHIRSVGPWTTNIRNLYDKTVRTEKTLPKIYLDGPYGEGHQDWNLHDVSILIGGGIGVTPFASILKNIVYQTNKHRCKKVYFIWVSRTQKQFEWLISIIRELEQKDVKNLISCHIFITQFYEKFDLRTTLLYICERHYQRISNRSLFTNLRAVTHFGRPNFPQFFKTIQTLHDKANNVGVFSCGPPSMTSAVDQACSKLNLLGQLRFEHHFKNF